MSPAQPPTGQPTLQAIATFLEGLVNDVEAAAPTVGAALSTAVGALETVVEVLDPAGGREVERESELAALFAAKDTAGLLVFYRDQPPHPNKSRAICANYLNLLRVDPDTGQLASA